MSMKGLVSHVIPTIQQKPLPHQSNGWIRLKYGIKKTPLKFVIISLNSSQVFTISLTSLVNLTRLNILINGHNLTTLSLLLITI